MVRDQGLLQVTISGVDWETEFLVGREVIGVSSK